MTKQIALTQGKVALVSDEDYEWLTEWKWFFAKSYKDLGYAVRKAPNGGGFIYLHREILQAPTDMQVDHINGDRLDNQRENLRLCTHSENGRNRKAQRGGTSQYKGVSWNTNAKKWNAQIKVDGRSINLGYFADEASAARAYDEAAIEYFGEFAHTNFSDRRIC